MRIKFKKVSYIEGIDLLHGKKRIEPPEIYPTIEFAPDEEPRDCFPEITYFDDGTCMALVSDWDVGYYGDIDGNAPLFYVGMVI